jgi:MFS family permease
LNKGKASAASATATITGRWRSGPAASRNFQLLAAGQFTSTVGDYCYAVALPWLVLSAHGGPVLLGTVLACYGVPRTVCIPAGGILADKIGPRAIMLGTDAVRCGLAAAFVVLATQRLTSIALLGPLAALLGAGEGLFLPASFTIMPSLLPAEQLASGNALSTAMIQVGSLLGPVLGGILVASAGSAPAFAVDAATFAVSSLTLALIRSATAASVMRPGQARPGRSAEPAAEPTVSPGARPAEPASVPGIEAAQPDASPGSQPGRPAGVWPLLRRERLLQVIVTLAVVANLAYAGVLAVALPTLAHTRFGAGGYGAMIACIGVGSVAGTLAATRGNSLDHPAVAACLSFLLEAVAVSLVPFLGGLTGAASAVTVLGVCNGFGNIIMITLLQQWAPSRLLGRVMSLVMLAAMGTYPISVVVAGAVSRSYGPSLFFPVAGIALALAVVGALSQQVIRSFGASAPPALTLETGPA